MVDRKDERPRCFGILDNVFPKVEEDMRATPESCFPCYYKTECLKQALESTDGLSVKEEKLDRAYRSGMVGFFERWSRKKYLQQKRKNKTP